MQRYQLNYWVIFLVVGIFLAPGIGFGNIVGMAARDHSPLTAVVPASSWTLFRALSFLEWLIFASLFIGEITLGIVTIPAALLIGLLIKVSIFGKKNVSRISVPLYAIMAGPLTSYAFGFLIGYELCFRGISYPVI